MSKEKTIRVIVKRPYKEATVETVTNSLATFQEIVGGLIERVPFPNLPEVDMYVNEEGKLIHLESNFMIPEYEDCVMGAAYVCGFDDDGNCVSLTDSQIEKVLDYINTYALLDGQSVWDDVRYFMNKAKRTMEERKGGNA